MMSAKWKCRVRIIGYYGEIEIEQEVYSGTEVIRKQIFEYATKQYEALVKERKEKP